jgi:competence protein ComEA
VKQLLRLALPVAVVAAVAGGVFLLVRSSTSGGGIQIVIPTPTAVPDVELKVYVTGAVRRPGVYELEEGSRLADVVEAAGGQTDQADLSAVNLAARVKDEDHWHIPTEDEVAQGPATAAQPAGATEKIDVNSATVEELKTLPGIGDTRAQAIVSYRDANGGFSSVDDLLEVPGIGSATLESIREMVEAR